MRLSAPAWLILGCLMMLIAACGDREQTGVTSMATSLAIASWVEPDGVNVGIEDVSALPEDLWQQGRTRFGYTRSTVWFRLDLGLPDDDGGDQWVLEFADPLIDRLDVYLPAAGRPHDWTELRMGDHQPFALRPLQTRRFAVPLDWPPGAAASVFVRVRTATSMHLPARLISYRALLDSDKRALVIDAIYIGVIGGLLLYNLLLMYRVREALYFYYASWLFMIALFVLAMNGLGFQYLWPFTSGWNDLSIVLSLLLSTFLLLGFWIRSIGEFIKWPMMPNDRTWLMLMVVVATLVAFMPYQIAIQVTIWLTLGCALGQVWLAILAGRNGFVGARGLLASFMPLLIAGYLLALQRFGLIDYSPATQHAIALGSALQAIMLSALLGDRLSRLRELNAAAFEMQRFNRSLGESNAALEASNCALREALEVSEARSRAIAEMKEKLRLAAEERNSEKSKFLAQAVHDLKQPLQAISIAVTPIQSLLGNNPNRQVSELVEVVRRAAQIMRNQISGLLDLSRLESGFIRPQIETIALRHFIEPLIDTFQAYGGERGVHIELGQDETEAVHIRSDPNLLRQILGNLVSNAIKYADSAKAPECRVRIHWRCLNGRVELTVEDNGIGVESRHLSDRAIFQPFFQAHNRLPEGEKGVGLGLSIVNAALTLMPDHGLVVESTFGVGSLFTLYMPKADAVADDAPIQPARREANPAGLAGKYVVLVDDDSLVRRSIVALLDHHEMLHDEFDSVENLTRKLGLLERRPDVLLSDYRLPDNRTALDVVAVMARIWPHVPTVVVTGDAEAAVTLAGRGDIAGVMHKPVSTAELLHHLARACELPEFDAPPDDSEADRCGIDDQPSDSTGRRPGQPDQRA